MKTANLSFNVKCKSEINEEIIKKMEDMGEVEYMRIVHKEIVEIIEENLTEDAEISNLKLEIKEEN